MSAPPDTKPTESGSADRTDTPPSVRSVAVGAASIAATFGAVAAFVIAGPVGLAVAGAVTMAGGAAAVRVARPKKSTRPGVLHALLTRPRRNRRPGRAAANAGLQKLLTGTSTGRGKKPAGVNGPSSTGRRGKRTGLGLPQLSALTAKGRAKRAAARATDRAGAHATRRGASAPRAAVRPGAKPGSHAARTPRTGASNRAGSRTKPTTAPGRPRPPQASPVRRGAGRGTGTATRRGGSKLATARPGGGNPARRAAAKAGVRPSSTGRPVRRTGGVTKPGMKFPRMSHRGGSTTAGTGVRRTSTGRAPAVLRNRKGAASSRVGTKGATFPRTSGKGATVRARRLATPPGAPRATRRDNRRPGTPSPQRSATRPTPFKKAPTRTLVKTAMRLPRRNGWKISQPTRVQSRTARRHLARRGRVRAGRAALGTVKLPFVAGRAAYRHRPLWLWPVAPSTVIPTFEPTVAEPKLKPAATRRPAPEPPAPKRPRNPYPKVHARRATGNTNQRTTTATKGSTMTTAPVQAGIEAAQMVGTYQTDSVIEFHRFLQDNAEIILAFGQNYRLLGQRAVSEMPFAAPVGDSISDVGTGFLALEALVKKMPDMLKAAHQDQWDALENRRPGQHMWDTQNN